MRLSLIILVQIAEPLLMFASLHQLQHLSPVPQRTMINVSGCGETLILIAKVYDSSLCVFIG